MMVSVVIRRVILCLLLAAIPVQGMASAAMLFCCDSADAGEAVFEQDASDHHAHAATDEGAPDEHSPHAAHAGHEGAHGGAGHDGHATYAKCGACAAFCSGGVIVSSAIGVSPPLSCASPQVAAPAVPFSSFFPDLAERPPLALL